MTKLDFLFWERLGIIEDTSTLPSIDDNENMRQLIADTTFIVKGFISAMAESAFEDAVIASQIESNNAQN